MYPSVLIHTVCYALIGVVYLCLGVHLYPSHVVPSLCSFALVALYAMLAASGLFHSAGPRVRYRPLNRTVETNIGR